MTESRESRLGEVGSVLMLMPVAVLIVMMLGGIAVDGAIRFQTQREAVADAQSIAHDAVSAIRATTLRATGGDPGDAGLDQAEVERRLASAVRARHLSGQIEWHVDGRVITVIVSRRTNLIFSGAVPGADSHPSITGTATALLVVQNP